MSGYTRLNPDDALRWRGEASGSMNNYSTTGMWRVASQINDMPNTTCYWGSLIVFKTVNYIQQIYIGNYTTGGGRIFVRTKTDPGWSSWEKVS